MNRRQQRQNSRGQVLLEFALIFPLQLIFTFALLQLILLMVGSLVVNYAAYRCARTAAVYDCAHTGTATVDDPCLTAARIILAPLAFTNTASALPIAIPGWENLRGTAATADRITLDIQRAGDRLEVKLIFQQELLFPLIDRLFAAFNSGGQKIFAQDQRGGRWCFPLAGYATVAVPPFPVAPASPSYEYLPPF